MTSKKQKADDKPKLNKNLRMEDVALLRKFTGDYFTPKNGYDFRKPLSRSRRATFDKYIEKLRVLTGNGYVVVKPKPGQKRAIYDYAGQGVYNKFSGAIIRTPKSGVKLDIVFDKTKPRGEQIKLIYPKLKQSEVKISREYILYFVHNEMREEFVEYIKQVAPDATTFIINSVGGSMWQRTAGDAEAVAGIVFELAEKYDTRKFSRTDYSHFDSWVESISCLSNERAADAYVLKRYTETKERRDKFFNANPWLERVNYRYSNKDDGYWITQDGVFKGFRKREDIESDYRKALKAYNKMQRARKGKASVKRTR